MKTYIGLTLALLLAAPALSVPSTNRAPQPITYVTKQEFDRAVSNMVSTVVTAAVEQIAVSTNLGYAGKAGWAYDARHATNSDFAKAAVSSEYAATSGVSSNSTTSGRATFADYAKDAGTSYMAQVAVTALDSVGSVAISNMVVGLTNQYVAQTNNILVNPTYIGYADCLYVSYSSNSYHPLNYFSGLYRFLSPGVYSNHETACTIRLTDWWEIWPARSDINYAMIFTNSSSPVGKYYDVYSDNAANTASVSYIGPSQLASLFDIGRSAQANSNYTDKAVGVLATGTVANALTADYATDAGSAETANSAVWAGEARHSTNSDYATYAADAGQVSGGAYYLSRWTNGGPPVVLYASTITNVTIADAASRDSAVLTAFNNYTNSTEVTLGRGSAAASSGSAVGYAAKGTEYGAALGNSANGYDHGAALGFVANASTGGVAVGAYAEGEDAGVAVGSGANGCARGVAVGQTSLGYNDAVAVGKNAWAYDNGAAVGRSARGYNYGSALGAFATGNDNGVGIGYNTYGVSGVAVGKDANGQNFGTAVGRNANGDNYGVAIGAGTIAQNGSAAIGTNLNNTVVNTLMIPSGTPTLPNHAITKAHLDINVAGLSNYTDRSAAGLSNYTDNGVAGLSNYVDSIPQLNPTPFYTTYDWINMHGSPGVVSGGELTVPTPSTIMISNAIGLLNISDIDYSTSGVKNTQWFTWTNSTFTVPVGTSMYVYLNYDPVQPYLSIQPSRDVCTFVRWEVCRVYLERIGKAPYVVKSYLQLGHLSFREHERLQEKYGITYGSGLDITVPNNYLSNSAGAVYFGTTRRIVPAGTSLSSGMDVYYKTNGVWVEMETNKIDTVRFSTNGPALATSSNGTYLVLWLYGSSANKASVQYGEAQYPSLEAARLATRPAPPSHFTEFCLYFGKIIVTNGSQNGYADIQYAWSTILSSAGTGGGQGGSGTNEFVLKAGDRMDGPLYIGTNSALYKITASNEVRYYGMVTSYLFSGTTIYTNQYGSQYWYTGVYTWTGVSYNGEPLYSNVGPNISFLYKQPSGWAVTEIEWGHSYGWFNDIWGGSYPASTNATFNPYTGYGDDWHTGTGYVSVFEQAFSNAVAYYTNVYQPFNITTNAAAINAAALDAGVRSYTDTGIAGLSGMVLSTQSGLSNYTSSVEQGLSNYTLSVEKGLSNYTDKGVAGLSNYTDKGIAGISNGFYRNTGGVLSGNMYLSNSTASEVLYTIATSAIWWDVTAAGPSVPTFGGIPITGRYVAANFTTNGYPVYERFNGVLNMHLAVSGSLWYISQYNTWPGSAYWLGPSSSTPPGSYVPIGSGPANNAGVNVNPGNFTNVVATTNVYITAAAVGTTVRSLTGIFNNVIMDNATATNLNVINLNVTNLAIIATNMVLEGPLNMCGNPIQNAGDITMGNHTINITNNSGSNASYIRVSDVNGSYSQIGIGTDYPVVNMNWRGNAGQILYSGIFQFGSKLLTGVAYPTNNTDAANKQYVDSGAGQAASQIGVSLWFTNTYSYVHVGGVALTNYVHFTNWMNNVELNGDIGYSHTGLNVRVSGVYEISCHVTVRGNSGANSYSHHRGAIFVNNTESPRFRSHATVYGLGAGSYFHSLPLDGQITLAANDFISVRVAASDAANILFTDGHLTIIRLRP